jgi:hypothetical protein
VLLNGIIITYIGNYFKPFCLTSNGREKKEIFPKKHGTAGEKGIPQNTRMLLESFFGIPFSPPVSRLF